MPGGLLFESFLVTNGKRSSQRAMLALAKTCLSEERECTADEAAELVAAERVGFYYSMLNVLGNRGRSANRQLFFLSLLAQAKGLSRTGMEVFAAMNVCLAPRTFDLELGSFLSKVEERERSRRSALIFMVRDADSTECVCAGLFPLGCMCNGLITSPSFTLSPCRDSAPAQPQSACGLPAGFIGMWDPLFPLLAARRARHAYFSLRQQRHQPVQAEDEVADAVSEGFLKDSICFRHTVRQVPLKP